jgi:hypothetical protein
MYAILPYRPSDIHKRSAKGHRHRCSAKGHPRTILEWKPHRDEDKDQGAQLICPYENLRQVQEICANYIFLTWKFEKNYVLMHGPMKSVSRMTSWKCPEDAHLYRLLIWSSFSNIETIVREQGAQLICPYENPRQAQEIDANSMFLSWKLEKDHVLMDPWNL